MDEQIKQAVLYAILAFNLVVIVFQLALNSGESFSYVKLLLGILLGAAIAGGVFFVVKKKNG